MGARPHDVEEIYQYPILAHHFAPQLAKLKAFLLDAILRAPRAN
jgi:hypothetical protein